MSHDHLIWQATSLTITRPPQLPRLYCARNLGRNQIGSNTGSLLHKWYETEMDKRSTRIGKREDHDDDNYKASPWEAVKEKEEEEVDILVLDDCRPAIEDPTLTIKVQMKMMFLWLSFSQIVAKKLVEDQGTIPYIP